MSELTYAEAIQDGFREAMRKDRSVILIGLGIPDPKGFFGTTSGLEGEFGKDRVMDMPCSENGMTGVVLGASLNGIRPVLNHQRLDFALLAMDQMCTQAAKWSYMFGGQAHAPVVFRMILGRGWGQGPQHSQALHSWFAHIPGLKVVLPSCPQDAKGLMISAIEDPNPVVYIDHRWLHHVRGSVPAGHHRTEIGPLRVAQPGKDVTIVAISYMVLEALEAAERLATQGIEAEVLDLRCLRPLDREGLLRSVRKTGRLVAVDQAWACAGMSAEILACIAEDPKTPLKGPPRRITIPDCPTPTAPSLAAEFYPRANHIVEAVLEMFGRSREPGELALQKGVEYDKPNPAFTGPF
jgi:acetoin:2,6-dichlorophenolindophenol oxidoreductase subunit beta